MELFILSQFSGDHDHFTGCYGVLAFIWNNMQIFFFDKFPSGARLLIASAILYGLRELLHSQYTSLSPCAILKYESESKMKDFPQAGWKTAKNEDRM